MRLTRVCIRCKVRLTPAEFDTPNDVCCKSCSLIGKRLIQKFAEMVESPVTGLADLGLYLDEWYVIA